MNAPNAMNHEQQGLELGFECTDEYHVVDFVNQGPKDVKLGFRPHDEQYHNPRAKPCFLLTTSLESMNALCI